MTETPAKLAPIETMRHTLTRMEAEFSCALPPQIPVQKFIRTTVTAVQMNPDLLTADRKSLLAACMKAAQDGLLIDGREAALVIFNGKNGRMVQYMPMIGGLLKKLRNSGMMASIAAHVVYENDEFRYELGDEECIVHRPQLGGPRGKPIAVYAIARTKDGAVYREVMSLEQVEQVRAVSKAKNNGPWVDWWDEMARKTVLRRLMKRLPSSADVDELLSHDNETYDLQPQVRQRPELGPGGLAARIADRVEVDPEEAEGEDPEPDPEREAIQSEGGAE